jgi:GNAT superfamily N-acetyltransferase
MTSSVTSIQIAETDDEILRCAPVLRELRPHLALADFLPAIRRLQAGGYVLARLETAGDVIAVAGYRLGESLARGRFLYVDDFVTHPGLRRQGHGEKLFNWLVERAMDAGCQELHLDSGVQRTAAHQFYEKHKMNFTSRHYALKLKAAW